MESILGSNKNIYSAGEIPNLKKIIRENFITSKKPISDFKNQVRLIFEWTVPNETLRV